MSSPENGRSVAAVAEGGSGTPIVSPLVSVGPVAQYLGVTRAVCYELCRSGILPHVRVGRRIRFSPEAILDWVADGGSGYPGGWRKEES